MSLQKHRYSQRKNYKKNYEKNTPRWLAMILSGGVIVSLFTISLNHLSKDSTPEQTFLIEKGFQRKNYHQTLIDKDQHVKLLSSIFKKGMMIDRVDFRDLPPPNFKESVKANDENFRYGVPRFFPSLNLLWPSPEDLPLEQIQHVCSPPDTISRMKQHSFLNHCPTTRFILRAASGGNDALVEKVLTKKEKTLGIRKGHEKEDAIRVSSTLYQWAQFATRKEAGRQQWLGWVCNPESIGRLERKHGILPTIGKKVMLLDSKNSQCIMPRRLWKQIWPFNEKTKIHDVILQCQPDKIDKKFSHCSAHFIYGGDMFDLTFPNDNLNGATPIDTLGATHVNQYLRPRMLESAWKALDRMNYLAHSDNQLNQNALARLRWDAKVCHRLLDEIQTKSQLSKKIAHEMHLNAPLSLNPNNNHCSRAVARAAAAWHASTDLNEQQRHLELAESIQQRIHDISQARYPL